MAAAAHTDIQPLMQILKASEEKYDLEKIQRAFDFANRCHNGQKRASGEPYICHPIAVAEIVASLSLDTDSICAALLHDTVEDCADMADLPKLSKMFGPDVAMLVDGLTKIVMIQVDDKEEVHIENLRKMLLAMSKDIRVIFIKLCDRLHNMRTLDAKPENKRRLTALETMQVYAPLAHRLGMQKIKTELENLGLQYLDPIGYAEVKGDIEKKYGQNLNFIENIRHDVESRLNESGIHYALEGRIKSVYSIYKKMYNQNKSFDEIYDFYALRIIVDTELECYTCLGIIHEMYNSIPGRFKDYISTPKPNMYRSLHTTVIGRDGIPFEVQIRTWEMHHVAEYGIAAHWKYKSGASSKEEMDKKLEWIARLVETEDGTRDPDEFMNALKTDIFHDEVFVFTPKGDVIALPQGATVIDFAYAIHSEVGNKMIGAKINGMIVPIERSPQSGEIVEILTSASSKGPSRDWLNLVKTSEARNKIRSWFKKQDRVDNIAEGRAQLDAEMKKYSRVMTESQRSELLETLAQNAGFNSVDDLCQAIGYGGITMGRLSIRIRDEYERRYKQPETPITSADQIPVAEPPKNLRTSGGIVVDGQAGCQVKFAKCCNPLPGDEVMGFVTRGYGISIHKKDCPNCVAGMSHEQTRDRWVDAHWESGSGSQGLYEAMIQILSEDRDSLLADIMAALSEMKISLLQVFAAKRGLTEAVISLKVGCRDVAQYDQIVARLRGLSGVHQVTRGHA
ncbi:MAG: bifunctional (p)ppGpp synthetase/guanosine-3',5'-bis(diphosphate) 3'-pyrophosphohydrolase [Clostridia bacterium]|nr:bifunctional (p)ppGpp synthetase/guanosine-3',5'-bis(diphosphate) 3'-pyrophosphohydrolase [Clostridia bacterium]